jgi:hypothetical protein
MVKRHRRIGMAKYGAAEISANMYRNNENGQ